MHSRLEQELDTLDRHLIGVPREERQETRDEAAQHLQTLMEAHTDTGLTEDEAANAALTEFGNAAHIGRGIQRESLRRQVRWWAFLVTAACGGAFGAAALVVIGNAPLMFQGRDAGVLYLLLGAVLGLSCGLRRHKAAWGAAGLLLTLLFLRPVLAFQEAWGVFPLVSEWVAYSWNDLSLPLLLPFLLTVPLIWARRVRLLPAFLLVVAAFALIAPQFEMLTLLDRPAISAAAMKQYYLYQLSAWIRQAIYFASVQVVLLAAARHLDAASPKFKGGYTTSRAADRPHKA